MSQYDEKALELVYKNAASREELEVSLEYHTISESDFFSLATQKGWEPGPVVTETIAVSPGLVEVSPEQIDGSNKASIRRMHSLLELAVTKLHSDIQRETLSTPAIIDQLHELIKMREKLTKLEMPLYGLTTAEPLTIVDPFNVFMASPEEVEEHQEKHK